MVHPSGQGHRPPAGERIWEGFRLLVMYSTLREGWSQPRSLFSNFSSLLPQA